MGDAAVVIPRKSKKRSDTAIGLAKLDGVLDGMRNDGWSNQGDGLGGRNGRLRCTRWSPRPLLDRHILEDLYEQSALIARIVDREPDDCTGEGFLVDGMSNDDTLALQDWMDEHEALAKIADARRWGLLYGGGAVFMQVEDSRPLSEPVDRSNIFAVRNLHVFERHDLAANNWATDLGSPNFGKPSDYRIVMGHSNTVVHASRLLLFDGVRVTRQKRMQNQGFGGSQVDQVWEQFQNWCVTHAYMAESITQLTQGVLKLKNLAKSLKGGNAKNVQKRLQTLIRGMSVLGDIVLDQESEDYGILARSVAGFKEALEAFTSALVAATPQPRSILLGEVPGGLNNGEASGEWRSWMSHCGSQQRRLYTPRVRTLLDYVFRSTLTPISERPDRIVVKWNPLFEPDPLVESQIHASNATARATDVTSGVVSPDEARRQRDVAEAYQLSDDEIAATESGVGTMDRKKTVRAELPPAPKLGV